MTREEVIRLACESGSAAMLAAEEFPHLTAVFERFASLVRQQALEDAKKVCVASELIDLPTVKEIAAIRKCAQAIEALKGDVL